MKRLIANVLTNSLLIVVTFAILFGVFEVGLRMFAPISVTNVGYVDRPNGEKYGWGFAPNELVRVESADTGKVIFDRVNSSGWRDRERVTTKSPGTFRVVVLGDSMTFGYLVSKEDVFTAVLEDQLHAENLDVEVINISYSGWGTDQALEALKLDGLKYQPDLVVYHFVSNDPQDNVWHEDPGKFGTRKPFYYAVEDDALVRHDNPRFIEEQEAITRKYIISKSEALKRAWLVSESLKHRSMLPYIYDNKRDTRIEFALGVGPAHPVFQHLAAFQGEKFDDEVMSRLVLDAALSSEQASNLKKVLINAPHNTPPLLSGEEAPDTFSQHYWALTERLIRELAAVSRANGAAFAILSDTDEGRFQWDRYWFRVKDNQAARDRYFEINGFLRNAVDGMSVDLIPNVYPHERAINDSHVNVAGNEAIARNLQAYIVDKFGNVLNKREK